MSDWQELDDLAAELRAANAAWAERVDALAGEGEPLNKLTADVEQQFADLGVREALEALAQRALAGAATIYEARRPFGYARSATLAWHPSDDPRAELATDEREALLTLDVAVGPRLLLGAGEGVPADDRLAVLIMGEKRMMATLPTSREKFRAALLRAFAAPRRGSVPEGPEAASGESAGDPEDKTSRSATEPDVTAERAQAASAFARGVAEDRAGEESAAADLRDGPPPTGPSAPGTAASEAGKSAESRGEDSPTSTENKAEDTTPSIGQQRPFEAPPDVIEL